MNRGLENIYILYMSSAKEPTDKSYKSTRPSILKKSSTISRPWTGQKISFSTADDSFDDAPIKLTRAQIKKIDSAKKKIKQLDQEYETIMDQIGTLTNEEEEQRLYDILQSRKHERNKLNAIINIKSYLPQATTEDDEFKARKNARPSHLSKTEPKNTKINADSELPNIPPRGRTGDIGNSWEGGGKSKQRRTKKNVHKKQRYSRRR